MISVEQLQVIKAIAFELKTYPPYILLSGVAFLYLYKKRKNGKNGNSENGNGKITKTNVRLMIKEQEGNCRDRFDKRIELAETKIIAEIKNNKKGK